jgi:tetratricopeptide (TPR) repeat protein
MAAESGEKPSSRRLDTWKEIATYFGRDERTVRRWETSRGLPVHRVPGGAGGTVYAFEAELAAWLRGHPETGESGKAAPDPSIEARPRTRLYIWLTAAGLAAVAVAFGLAQLLSSREAGPVPSKTASHNLKAVAFYRSGLYEWQTRTPVGLERAVADFKQAVARDPNYAEAYVGLANCYNLLREYTTMPASEAYPRAKAAAERAVALDPAIAEAHAALAFDDFYWSRDVRSANREFLRALTLDPSNAAAHHWYATFLMTIREFPQAVSEIEKAQALDSASTAILADKGLILFNDGRSEEAVALLSRLEQAEPAFLSPHQYLASIFRARGDDRSFLREIEAAAAARHSEADRAIADAGVSGFAAGGRDAMFKSMLNVDQLLYARGKISAYELALAYADVNDEVDAIACLKLSLSRHETDNVALAVERRLDGLRAKPEFRPLLSMAGLDSHV